MSQNHKPNPANEELAAALTAYALGELSPQEGARIAQQVQREPGLQREVEQIRRLATALRPEVVDTDRDDGSWGKIPAADAAACDASTRAAVLAALEGSPLPQSLIPSAPVAATALDPLAQDSPAQRMGSTDRVGKISSQPERAGHRGGWRLPRAWLAAVLSTAALLICAVFLIGPLMNARNVAMQAPGTRAPAATVDHFDARVPRGLDRSNDQGLAGAESNPGGSALGLSAKGLAATEKSSTEKFSTPGAASPKFESTELDPAAPAGGAGQGFSAETLKKSSGLGGGKLVSGDQGGTRADTAIAESMAPPAPLTDSLAANQPAPMPELMKENAAELEQPSRDEFQPEPQSPADALALQGDAKQPSDPTTARELGQRRQAAQLDGLEQRNGMRTNAVGGVPGSGGLGGGGGLPASEADGSGRFRGELADLPRERLESRESTALPELAETQMYFGGELGALNRRGRDSSNEQYQRLWENPFVPAAGASALSTLAIDVDTASYANVRRFLRDGSLPPPAAVRIEEFVNYFKYPYPQPDDGQPFRVDLKLFGCPWNSAHSLLRVGVQGRDVPQAQRPPTNLVFLIDVSGSMSSEDKLPLLKRGLQLLVSRLTESDSVSLVTYAGEAGVALPPTKGSQQRQLLEAIEQLQSGGSTHGSAGIEMAYQLAEQQFVQGGVNRVLWATDGDLNVGVTDDQALVELIKQKAASGVFLTVLGFGTGNLKDAKLESLADNGNGVYAYIDAIGEAHKVLVEQMSSSLVTIAKDVKIQIEFNPAQVEAYRLIGYENRVLATQDFADDRKDGGEIGAGHSVTALYEIVPAGATLQAFEPPAVDLKYQRPEGNQRSAEAAAAAEEAKDSALHRELATVAIRYKAPDGQESAKVEFAVDAESTSFSQADDDSRFAAAVAAFAMRLRNSVYAGSISYEAIAEIAGAARGADPQGYRAEFIELVQKARQLASPLEAAPTPGAGIERE